MRYPLVAALLCAPVLAHAQTRSADWPLYGGTTDNTRYSTLGQITPKNVASLQVAWRYETHDEGQGTEMQANPVVIAGVLYFTTPALRVVALEAATGKELWSFDPKKYDDRPGRYRHRGVTVWQDRVLVTHRNWLWALDRKTGRPITSFGDSGRVDLRNGFDRPPGSVSISSSTPGVVYGDLLILGSSMAESLPSTPGDIRAFDLRTGAIRWTFHTIPRPGEFGYETWSPDAWKVAGGANVWAGFTVDQATGIVYGATGSASFDFYGANRIGDNLFANTILALDAKTGRRIWHFQGVKHDLWDMDFPAPPSLVTVTRGGKKIPALAQLTKTGHIWVLDRRTGAPLFPVKEMPVPASRLDGEVAAATQRVPALPEPLVRQTVTEADLTTRTPAAHQFALETFRKYEGKGLFFPPSESGSIVFPGYDGGAEWGGAAWDPETGLLYANVNEMAWLLKMLPRNDKTLYGNYCASCHKADRSGTPPTFPSLLGIGERRTRTQIYETIRQGAGRMPAFGETLESGAINDLVNYLITGKDMAETAGSDPNYLKYRNDGYAIFNDPDGDPAISPPWGTLNAVDLNTGKIRWRIPFGEYPALAKEGLKGTGTDNYGGPVVTANGLLFIGATTYDRKFHVYDKRTGKLLWETELPAAGNATPSLYMVNGRQYVVIACGGGKNGAPSGGTLVAFALPGR